MKTKHKLAKRVLYFSNKGHCQRICCLTTRMFPETSSDHEEADTKVIALVESSGVEHGQSVMIRLPYGDIDKIVLFLLHHFDGTSKNPEKS